MLTVQALEMPPEECCQEHLIHSLAAQPGSEACRIANETLFDLTVTHGLDYVFGRWDIDALVVNMEYGYIGLWTGAAGYPAVRHAMTCVWFELTRTGSGAAWLLPEWLAVWTDVHRSALERSCPCRAHVCITDDLGASSGWS
jgi:hypothetical protein